MSDPFSISGSSALVVQEQASVYRDAREVHARARVTRRADPPAIEQALDRLDRALDSGQPLSRDVPRGYYINIKV